ncbi:MAG TPA: transcription termination/antitermination protein NusA [Candidatus Avisuccinivibrio pullicola]|nr:transcription termination/antitermination protein NusA [Candidatus Avisuccinivibrio pullicola]
MGKEIIAIAEALSNERAIPRDKIFEALETALATATKKNYAADIAVRVTIDPKDGSYRTFRRWEVVADDAALENPAAQTTLEAARLDNPEVQVGDFVEDEIESVAFNRITIQTAKQVLSQKVKDAEREQIVAEQMERLGHVINATVKKQGRDFMILDLGNNAEAVLKREQIIPHETFGRGDRIKVLLAEIRNDAKGPQIICSRTSPEFLKELFRIEVPEIGEDIIEVMGVARDPGSRAKIAVRSKDKRIDPRGACIGMRGARVMAVSNELSGEKIDVVLWDENLAQYVTNAMEPAEVSRIIINEDTHSIEVGVADDNLALAIGRNGQNVRLASQLLGWNLNVTAESEMEKNLSAELSKVVQLFVDSLNIDEDFASVLADMGFTTLDEIAYVPVEEFMAIDGMDEETAQILQQNARAAIEAREAEKMSQGFDELLKLDGMDDLTAGALMANGITSAEDLAEMASDELTEKVEGLDEERAGKLIMAARNECWFKDEPQEAAPVPASDEKQD